MADETKWALLGWQGMALEMPADWYPGRLEGDYANGYLRVEDELHVRLELRWETPGRRIPAASLLVDNYVKQTLKKLGRREARPEIERGRCVPQLGKADHEVFTWRGSFNAHSLLLVCPESKRVVHLRVFFEGNKELKALTRRIFASARTTSEDGLDDWSVFGFHFRVARSWRLEQSGLKTGCLQFVFGDEGDELEVARVSLAGLALRDRPLEKWFESIFAKALKRYRYALHPEAWRGHLALRCEGQIRARAQPLGLFRRRRYVAGLAWHCEADDKLFGIRLMSRTAGDARAAACAETILCT